MRARATLTLVYLGCLILRHPPTLALARVDDAEVDEGNPNPHLLWRSLLSHLLILRHPPPSSLWQSVAFKRVKVTCWVLVITNSYSTLAEVDKEDDYPRLLQLVLFGAEFKNEAPTQRYDYTLPFESELNEWTNKEEMLSGKEVILLIICKKVDFSIWDKLYTFVNQGFE